MVSKEIFAVTATKTEKTQQIIIFDSQNTLTISTALFTFHWNCEIHILQMVVSTLYTFHILRAFRIVKLTFCKC